MGAREEWIKAACQAADTGSVTVECPENQDATLQLEWIPTSTGCANEGEYRIWCPVCGSQNFVRVGNRQSP